MVCSCIMTLQIGVVKTISLGNTYCAIAISLITCMTLILSFLSLYSVRLRSSQEYYDKHQNHDYTYTQTHDYTYMFLLTQVIASKPIKKLFILSPMTCQEVCNLSLYSLIYELLLTTKIKTFSENMACFIRYI